MIPELGQTNLNFSSFIILLGVVQGILLTITGLLHRQRKAKFKALLFFCISCTIAEIFLNRTGYMYYVIRLVDFSEPLEFAIAPLVYLVVVSLDPNAAIKKWWLHFILLFGYLLYFVPFYLAPISYKMESYYFTHHLVDWHSTEKFELLTLLGKFRMFQLQICLFQITVYLVLCFQLLWQYKRKPENYPTINPHEVNWWIVFNATITVLLAVILIVKVIYVRDIGDHIIAFFFTLIIYYSAITELVQQTRSSPIKQPVADLAGTPRYVSSGIKEEKKDEIKQKLLTIMNEQKVYADSLISLAKIAKLVGEPPYMVSQVINERMEVSFYDWIAKYRVEEAKRLFTKPQTKQFTIEQIAEEVGYNSKSAFNKAFKKFTGKTPSEYKSSDLM